MKKRHTTHHIGAPQLTALLLALFLLVGLIPVSAHATQAEAHFTDVPVTHWAYQYVERAYTDGAIVGKGGDPSTGSGIFDPDSHMTYGQFFTMLVNAFYPEELERVSKDGPWYAPAFQVSVNRQLNFNTMDQLMELASYPINRYNASWVLVRILDDKCAVLPTGQEREDAAEKISDWDTMLQDDCWKYYVSAIYASGIITGVDSQGTFAGESYITRASATVLYTRMADKLNSDGNDPEAFQLIFDGDWSVAPEGFQEAMEEEFYTLYPRLWARWGNSNVSKCIPVQLVSKEELGEYDGVTCHEYDGTRHQRTPYIKLLEDTVNGRCNFMRSKAVFAHELAHAATTSMWCGGTSVWLAEALADYGLFRYLSWADEGSLCAESFFQQDDEALRTWEYKPYVSSQWFFAYLDNKYPTTEDQYGLTDSILLAMQNGQVTSDGGADQSDAALNALIEKLTGFHDVEALRQQFVKELDAGEWVFDGFAGYADNDITEGIPGVPEPTYPKQSVVEKGNLCFDSGTYGGSGEASAALSADNLVDGDRSTRWEASRKDVAEPDLLNQGVKHAIAIDLGTSMTFNTYTLYHEGSQGGNSRQNTKSWRVNYYDAQEEKWKLLDEVKENNEDATTRTFDPVTTSALWLEVLNPSGTGDGTVRLYELEVYDRR